MIKLFEFQEKEIRTAIEDTQVWFSGQDIYNALGLTWKGEAELKKRKIPAKWRCKKGYATSGGLQEMTFISEHALYLLAFSTRKTEHSIKFSEWVADLLVRLRTAIESGKADDVRKHLFTDIQKGYSKQINSKNFIEGGFEQTIEYNTKNCFLHTGKTPIQIKEIGKNFGLKSKDRSSAKEVIRNLKPELACSMSFTDKLVSENGVNHEEAAKTSIELAQPLFKKLMELGIDKKQLL
jgi:prophage antirepressor-like protein